MLRATVKDMGATRAGLAMSVKTLDGWRDARNGVVWLGLVLFFAKLNRRGKYQNRRAIFFTVGTG